jgi:hypothetical protein
MSASATGPGTARDLTRFAWLSIPAALLTLTIKTVAAAMAGSVGLLSVAADRLSARRRSRRARGAALQCPEAGRLPAAYVLIGATIVSFVLVAFCVWQVPGAHQFAVRSGSRAVSSGSAGGSAPGHLPKPLRAGFLPDIPPRGIMRHGTAGDGHGYNKRNGLSFSIGRRRQYGPPVWATPKGQLGRTMASFPE